MSKKILVVDDEESILELIGFNLKREGFQVITALEGREAIEKVKSFEPDLVILDVMLPEVDGFQVCQIIRRDSDVPIIMLTARSHEVDKVLGLGIGADDYVTKPFSCRELVARVRALLRRQEINTKSSENIIRHRDITVDLDGFVVQVNGERVELTPKEFELFKLLISNPGKVLTRDYLMDRIWGYDYDGDTRTVDVHVRHLRRKIEKDPSAPRYIETVHGMGYRFEER